MGKINGLEKFTKIHFIDGDKEFLRTYEDFIEIKGPVKLRYGGGVSTGEYEIENVKEDFYKNGLGVDQIIREYFLKLKKK